MFARLDLPGCVAVDAWSSEDDRGRFVKVFHAPSFVAHGLAATFAEEFYTVSSRGALRGMHFQVPPHAHTKLVHCVSGVILDVLLDLRVGSPTFGQHRAFELSGAQPRALYIAPGVAHGFYTLSEEATVVYSVTTVHAPASDTGVRWDSFGMAWPNASPILSARDRALPGLAEFASPFAFTATDEIPEP
jgi:dTDP-4-dehydrorhamnose 3,5-epimerase